MSTLAGVSYHALVKFFSRKINFTCIKIFYITREATNNYAIKMYQLNILSMLSKIRLDYIIWSDTLGVFNSMIIRLSVCVHTKMGACPLEWEGGKQIF